MYREHSKTYHLDHYDHEVSFAIEYNLVKNDYGVSNSPTFYSVEDLKYGNYTIDGIEYTDKEIVKKFGKPFLNLLDEGASDLVKDDDELAIQP